MKPGVSDPPGVASSVDALPNNLPAQLTSFVGRQRELADIGRALAGTRLLTLTGSGGCGKTRLAMQAVWGRASLSCRRRVPISLHDAHW